MAKQLSVNERKYLFEKYEKYMNLGNSSKKMFFLKWNDENKKCINTFLATDSIERDNK
nr:hypothetical protein [Mycoplasmopsis bovis]